MNKYLLSISLFFISIFSFSQLNMQELGNLDYAEELSDIWGYVDETGNEYALVGVYNGLSIVDVSDPNNPVEVHFEAMPLSGWRDIKTFGDYAYVSNETGSGVNIVDLSPLPDGSINNTSNFTGENYPFQTAHNLFVDEHGRLYILGSDFGWGGAIICDLTQDPMNPVELGDFSDFYLHDGMVKNDILWGSAMFQGFLAAIDVSDPANPVLVGSKPTPGDFTHNAWASEDGSHVFTTDEVLAGFISAFNVSDLSNMYLTDRTRSSAGTDVIPHNVHVINDFLVTSYYTDGVVIHDAKFPDKVYETGNFDTAPLYAGGSFHGCWGVYPYLPSGIILASDIEEGLYVLDVDYVRATHLQGKITNPNGGGAISNVKIEIAETELATYSAFDGSYEISSLISGSYDVVFSKEGFESLTVQDVELINGEITIQDAELQEIGVGMAENPGMKPEIFPNPFSDYATIKVPAEFLPGTIKIFGIYGSKLKEINISNMTSRFGEDLEQGIYLIQFSNNRDNTLHYKIIKSN